jgi:Tfp pilus assembly protein PilZ
MGLRVTEHILRMSFESAEAFQSEYATNLANGGVFIATDEDLQLRQPVRVELVLAFCRKRLTLVGEVVHRMTPEMARMGAPVGVAVQFEGTVQELRKRLEPLRALSGAPQHQPKDSGRRKAPRRKARVAARIDGDAGEVAGHTRDLSRSGVMVSVPGKGVPVGDKVRLALTHPTSGESMEVDGVVVREIETDGAVSGLGIAFEPAAQERGELERFVEGVQSSEHARRLGGISGDIGELGMQNLLPMFTSTARAGTLTLCRGEDEGVIGFDGGLLRFARLGPASGMKALLRLMAWSEGRFEFHAHLDPVEETEAPLPLEAALFDAVRLLDEEKRIDRSRLPADAKPRVTGPGGDAEDLSKVESAVLDLVRAGFTVQRMVDVIPEPDPEIYRALESLSERGAICF